MATSPHRAGSADGRIRWTDLDPVPLLDGIVARTTSGTEISVTEFELEPGAVVPEHAHPNDEFGYVVAGGLHLWYGNDDLALDTGDSFFVSRDVRHRAVAGPEGCRLIECYGPPRVPAAPGSTGRTS